jgi:PAS domain S-box-containing protein
MRLTFRKKALLFILPILAAVSVVYTYEAIRTEKEIVRTEIIKRAEAITALATKTGELPILSGNSEVMKSAISSLRENSEVTSVAFYDKKLKLLGSDGSSIVGRLPILSANSPMSMFEEGDMFIFYAPVFTVREGEDIDIFHEGLRSRKIKENIGWVRLGFSKDEMNEALSRVVLRGFIVAVVFTIGSSIALFFLIALASRPLMVLFNAVKKLEKGEYTEIREVSSSDEIGELAVAFNSMSAAIKDRESRLVESENRIRELFDRVEHAIFRLNKDGVILEANSKFREMFGDVRAFRDILSNKDQADNSFKKASSSSATHMEEKVRAADGTELTVLLSLYADKDRDGDTGGFDGYIIDITEKKRLEERLLRSQKLEAVGTLAGGIAHDFNNILQAILGYSELMIEMTKEGDPFYKPAHIIHNAAGRGAELTKTILSVTRKEKMQVRPVDINEVVKISLELLRRSIPKNIEIAVNLGTDVPMSLADPAQIQQVVLNLAVNARDAMPGGGRLDLETSVVGPAAGETSAGARKFIRLSVSDNGSGMDKATKERIFDPFFTTKDAGKGTGLGLYIVHSIVTNHGGHINLNSEEGKGTRFNVFIPVVEIEDSEELPEEGDLGGTETILIIDDEASVREACVDMLKPLGYDIVLAEGGRQGVELFDQIKDKVSLILLDMVMPRTSGTEVFHALKAVDPSVRVLLCSGYSQEGYEGIERLLKAGANGFVQKPFTRQYIAAAIRNALSV